MRKRSEIKQRGNGLKLVDDVTRPNTDLITALLKHSEKKFCVVLRWIGTWKADEQRKTCEIRHT